MQPIFKYPALLILLLLAIASPCAAAKQFKCDGKIQYRPCNQSFAGASSNRPYLLLEQTQRNAVRASLNGKKLLSNKGELYAEVLNTSFGKYKSGTSANGRVTDGQWRGLVKGNGDIHLTLQILRNGLVYESRYMGHVILKDDQTTFNFISSIPAGFNWNWKIEAVAKSV